MSKISFGLIYFKTFQRRFFVIAAGNDSRFCPQPSIKQEMLPKTWEKYKENLLAGKIPGFKSLMAQIKLPNTITVGSYVGEKLERSSFSNYNNQFVDIMADGDEIESTLPEGKMGT